MSNSRLFSDCQRVTRALLSIKPLFAAAILRGEKRYEYRRSIFSRQVDIVLVYVSSPVRRVVAEFDITAIITKTLPQLWQQTRKFAGIDESLFYKYFQGVEYGHAIAIGNVRLYDNPFCPVEAFGLRPPQSFIYLPEQKKARVEATGN